MALVIDHHSSRQNQQCLHRFRQPWPWRLRPNVIRYNALQLGQNLANQSFRDHQLVANALRNFAPYELARHRLRHRRVGATYPLPHQLHVHSLRDRVLDVVPFQTSDARCDDELVLNHRAHQEVRASKLLNMRIREMNLTFQMKHQRQQSCRDTRQL